ncbi:MAG: efflux RND transporter permease subunit [Acidaminococcaceae bacterium]|nr:efflux RND transporter permease subunit [Acidaminococcaceae bacterium]
MNFIDTSLRRPVTVIITTLAIIFFGVYVYNQMPMQKRPDTDFPMVTVITTMSGANATIMDNDVADVLEDKINGISGVSSIQSRSYQGRSVTMVEFDMDKNVNDAASDVRDKVSSATNDLPDEADTPIVQKLDITTDAIIQLAITGDATEKDKTYYVDKILKPRLQSVNNVGSIETAGLREREIRIWVNPATLHSRGLVMSDIATALQNKHVELPAGSILEKRYDVDLRVNAEYATVEELKSLPITTTSAGSVIRLGEVARVEDDFAEQDNTAMYNDNKTIIVSVKKQSGANEVKLSEDVLKVVAEVEKNLPSGIKINLIYNQADFIRSSIEGAQTDIMSAILLCSILMFIFLQTFRATFVTVITIPVCILGSCVIMQKMGITLNALSMMGIALSVGMVVDATTVVLENVDRYLHEGLSPIEAASKGAHEVAFSVIGGVLTTVAVFSPIAFMSGIVGKFFRAFGLTIILTISLSLLLSMTLTPFLCSRLLKVTRLSKIGAYFNGKFNSLENSYRQVLSAAVYRRKTTMLVAAGLFASGIFLASVVGTSFIPSQDEGTFQIKCELPSGSSIDESARVLQDMGKVVRQNPYVKYTYTQIGTNTGNEKNCGTIYVQLIPRNERPTYTVVQEQVRAQTNQFRDVIANFTTIAGKDVTMTLVGPTTEALLPVANKIMAEARSSGNLKDVESDVRMDKPEFDVKLNRGLTDILNVNVRSLSTELGAIFGGQKVGVFKDEGYRYDIRMMADKGNRDSLSSLSDVYAKNGAGDIIQANNLFTVDRTNGPNVIKRYNRQRSLTISANVTQDYSSGQAMEYLTTLSDKYAAPDSGIKIVPTGLSKYMQDDFRSLGISIIVAICLVYVIMAIQFESFMHPFVVMFSLPLLTPGAFGLLFLTNCKLDMMSYMGLILLVGIVVNNGIILVDFINQERAKGVDKVQAVITSGPRRLRAILITAASTMIGAVPAALQLTEGSEMRQGMSIAIFGGLLTSTLLTLLVIPVVYLILDDFKDSYSEKIQRVGQQVLARLTKLKGELHHD